MYEDYLEQLFFAPVKYFKDTVMAKWKGRQVPVINDMIRVRFFFVLLKNMIVKECNGLEVWKLKPSHILLEIILV